MPYVIQYYGPAIPGKMPEMKCVEVEDADLAATEALALSHVAPGGLHEGAQTYEIMAYDFESDPCVARWSRSAGSGRPVRQ